MRRVVRVVAAVAALVSMAAPVSAQVFLGPPRLVGAPVTGSEPGLGLPLNGASSEDYAAALLWNLRAGLNVAALQCQNTKFLDAIANYNNMLNNHQDELQPAYDRLLAFFKRTQSVRAFDDYNTKTYNGFSTLYAQQNFCNTAADIGRDVAFAPRGGGLARVAQNRMREFRNSLVPAGDSGFATRYMHIPSPGIPDFAPKCYKKDGTVKASCLRERS